MKNIKLYPCFKHWLEYDSIKIISDTHFDDSDCKYMNPNWILPEEHMKILKKELNKQTVLIHLGDVGNVSYLNELKCYKVLITGNHDKSPSSYKRTIKEEIYNADIFSSKELKIKLLKENPFCTVDLYESFELHAPFHRWIAKIDNHLFDEIYTGPLFIADRILLSHEPIYGLEEFCVNIHGHVHNGAYKEYNVLSNNYTHINMASDVCDFTPIDLGKEIKNGLISNIPNYHRITIDNAILNPIKE